VHTSLMVLHHVLLATTPAKKSKGSGVYPILFIAVLFGLAYFLFLRPARGRQQAAVAAAAKNRQVEVGDEVTTTAGLIATVVTVTDDEITLEVAPGVHCRYVPAAILRVNGADDEADEDGPDASTHEVIDDPEASAVVPDSTDEATDSTETTDKTDGSAPA
jgi:preprotein translocase subunit YajC